MKVQKVFTVWDLLSGMLGTLGLPDKRFFHNSEHYHKVPHLKSSDHGLHDKICLKNGFVFLLTVR